MLLLLLNCQCCYCYYYYCFYYNASILKCILKSFRNCLSITQYKPKPDGDTGSTRGGGAEQNPYHAESVLSRHRCVPRPQDLFIFAVHIMSYEQTPASTLDRSALHPHVLPNPQAESRPIGPRTAHPSSTAPPHSYRQMPGVRYKSVRPITDSEARNKKSRVQGLGPDSRN